MTDVQPVPIADQVTPKTEGKTKDDVNEAPPALEVTEGVQFVDPFDGQTTRINQIKRPIQIAQLIQEIATASGTDAKDIQASIAVSNPSDQPGAVVVCSTTNQGVLYLSPKMDEDMVRTVISNHTANEHHAVDDVMAEWSPLREKILDGGDLSNDEVAKALKIIALKLG